MPPPNRGGLNVGNFWQIFSRLVHLCGQPVPGRLWLRKLSRDFLPAPLWFSSDSLLRSRANYSLSTPKETQRHRADSVWVAPAPTIPTPRVRVLKDSAFILLTSSYLINATLQNMSSGWAYVVKLGCKYEPYDHMINESSKNQYIVYIKFSQRE